MMKDKLPKHYQGILYILGGATVILYALGILGSGITIIIIGLASVSIAIGCSKLGLLENVSSWFHRRRR
jgi:hypothetical protein